MATFPKSHQAWERGFGVADAEGFKAHASEGRGAIFMRWIQRACKLLSQQQQTRHTGARGQVGHNTV